MNDQLNSDLRTALRARASLVPDASVVRLTAIDYHPRRSRLRPPVALGATATAGAAAGVAALLISLGTGASSAFAGWTAKPTAPAPGQLRAAGVACEASQSPVSGLPLKLADTRGPYTFAIYADSETSATCIDGPTFVAASTSASSIPVSVPDGQILFSSAHRTDRAGQAFSFSDGRTGAGVTGVTLLLDNGTTVQATVGNGWFVAWWPGGNQVKSAQITTPAGVKTQTFNFPPEGATPPGSQASESQGVAGGAKGSTVESTQGFSVSK
jgi:hypothetical protein